MTSPVGTTVYIERNPPCHGTGVSLTETETIKALHEDVAPQVFDAAGRTEIDMMLSAVVETEFEQERLAEVLSDNDYITNWGVGEALAEAYLTHNRACYFPWPSSRDERKPKVSLPGADLVGFKVSDNGDAWFAYGEVKTSSDENYPPGVVYGDSGLQHQVKDLRDKKSIREDLFKYLGFRASQSSWHAYFVCASKRYLQDDSNVCLFGVLIRDVEPSALDLKRCVQNLGETCPSSMAIELLAIYLPHGRIANLNADVRAAGRGGEK